MMDHARHLSSPSPTSPFLFHHSERSFKSNPLTPLLSSTADVTSVDDCFSTASSNISHQSHNPFGVDHHHHSLVDSHHHHHHHHHQQNHRRHNDQCVIDQDSLTGVDDDDGMHNMLSGSSTSSNSTMPLLTESHSHHSFSRISLEEYSPLSLVEDCDNALPISPTSLACGSHHSFKSSLNGLKMDNLVGDVGDHDVHDDVNDARSLSPTLLSSSASSHHNLWSTSSTAITQNTSLLNSTSTSFLLSQHHQHQLNTLIQQLEPQSLDEPPPLVSNSTSFESNSIITNRPSSEPPSGCGVELQDVESKSLNSQPLQPNKLKQTSLKTSKSSTPTNTSTQSSAPPSRTRKSRSRSNSAKTSSNSNDTSKNQSFQVGSDVAGPSSVIQQNSINSSKLHLQLNHQKKLQELQQRLFGTSTQNNATTENVSTANKDSSNVNFSANFISTPENQDQSVSMGVKEEPDSSAHCKKETAKSNSQTTVNKTRTRQTRSRRNRNNKNETCNPSSSTQLGPKTSQKLVTTESVEPDTTTKSSDCIKLADLLSNTNDTKSNSDFGANGFSSTSDINNTNNDNDNSEKRLQQIQIQVSPSLTVVSNGGVMQSIGNQQQQQQQQQQQPVQQQQLANGSVITTSGATFTNQILCRPQTVVATTNGQLKGIMSNNELLKSGETMVTNWPLQSSNCGTNNTTTIPESQTIGAHQIAIQVICQDGTSLVLPVSSTAGLNAAVSLTSQHQQLQAVLANNANQQRNNSNQLLPLMSVSNIVAQQQFTNTSENGVNQSNSNSQTQTSGLAASSPTLAALLDAGSNRNNNDLNNINGNFSSQNFVSTNLLRKLVGGNSATELKRGELTLQQGSTLNLSNCGSLVTVFSPNNNNNNNNNDSKNNGTSSSQATNKNVNVNGSGAGEKRIKLENAEGNTNNNAQATFTLIEPQGLIVANGNEKSGKQSVQTSTSSSGNNVTTNSQQNNLSKTIADANKQIKMGSSTGNRQVDPTQPFRCEHCNSTFTRLGNFTRHKKIHTVPTKDGQRFKCDVCSKSFLQRCDLARHLHIHRGTEPHRCNICGKGYIRHSDLVTHQRFHNKEKPFGCPHCSKGFCQRGDLNRHLRSIHLQMKPILCPCCNRKFAKQETLLRHLNTAHRSKSGTTNGNAVITELPPNYTLIQTDDKQNTISVVTNATSLNNNIAQKNAPVASLQAIQATLCKVSQSVDQFTTSGLKSASSAEQATNTAKAAS